MNKSITLAVALSAAAIFTAAPQGPLTPPGAPAPTMKTLDQVEPRTPISSLPFTITAPGSYYLTANLTGVSGPSGITINASNVSIDLNGFTLQGVPGSSHGIDAQSGIANLSVRNGTVTGWGGTGINLFIPGGIQRIADILAANNGGGGITGTNATITNCTARANGSTGIALYGAGVISNCLALSNTGTGMVINEGGVIIASSSRSNAGTGIQLFGGRCVVTDCAVVDNGVNGINAGSNNLINKCSITLNTGNGVTGDFSNRIVDNLISRNTVAGVELSATLGAGANHIENNTILENATGLRIGGVGNDVARNVVRRNTSNYNFAAGNQLSLILSQLPQSIDWPALVTLAGDLTGSSGQNGITINSDDVTIDLGGHALTGIAGSLDGILVSGTRSHVNVRNGSVQSWGDDGINASTSFNGQFEKLNLTGNGASGTPTGRRGLAAGDRAIVTGCIARSNFSHGIAGGIICNVSNCVAALNAGFGIVVSETGLIEKCNLNNNGGAGISVTNNSVVRDNLADFHTIAAGINVSGSRNRIEGNNVTRNQQGINVTASGNLIIKNSASGSTSTNYNFNSMTQTFGAIFSGGGQISADPWANFAY